jgi:aminopeptidase N
MRTAGEQYKISSRPASHPGLLSHVDFDNRSVTVAAQNQYFGAVPPKRQPRPKLKGICLGIVLSVIAFSSVSPAHAQTTPSVFEVTNYTIDATIYPSTHMLTARARIQLVPETQSTSLSFRLDSSLHVKNVTGASGESIQFAQQGLNLTLSPTTPLPAGQSAVLTVDYSGILTSSDGSPVEGLMLSYIGTGGSYLLYPGCWFPVNGPGLDRFSATLHVTVPEGQTVIASGESSAPENTADGEVYSFHYDRESFPGTVLVGPYVAIPASVPGMSLTTYMYKNDANYASSYGSAADKILAYYAGKFGVLPSKHIALVEMPDGTLGGYSGPGVVAIAKRGFTQPVDYALLAHEISHQWWPCLVSPATPNDAFLDDGLSTYSSALFIQDQEGESAFEDRMHTIAIDALIHEGESPIAQAGQLQPFSPEYQSIVYDKGAMVLHMLRWVIGDNSFFNALRTMAHQYAWHSVSTAQFQKLAEQASKQSLTYFFAQWVDSTGVPQFHRQWAIYRTRDGYQVVGKVQQNLDIFRMPVDVRVYIRGGLPVNERLMMIGTAADFTINTSKLPMQVVIDPASDILKYTRQTRVQVEMASADQLAQAQEYFAAIDQYRKVLQQNQNNSLAHYRIGDILFTLHNYNASLEEFQDALNGDLQPKWVEVWSYLKIGEVFDATGQRDRALNEYERALHTNDNTQGALDLANHYIQKPFTQQSNQVGA